MDKIVIGGLDVNCLRCGTKMDKGFTNTCIQILERPQGSELVIDDRVVTARSAYVCDKCGYIEFSNKEFNSAEENYEFTTFVN